MVCHSTTIRSLYRAIFSPGNNGPVKMIAIAQGNLLNKRVSQEHHQSHSSSSSSYSTFCATSPGRTPFSSRGTSKLFTRSSHPKKFRNSCDFLKPSGIMAAASVFRHEKSYNSSAILQPQLDSLDESVDPVQRQLLEEQCIVLNDKDQVIGHDTKRNCHRVVNGDVLLHRAFSVFLFNGKGELLLQQRSKTKITFPLMWTNTCCSHPLYTPSELEEKDAIGVRTAARRRLEIELGIPQESINLDDFHYLTRIHYKALSNSIWGEHEIDYILFLQKDGLEINPSPDEIQEIRWVSLEDVKEMVRKEKVELTPWFELIKDSNLPLWWQNLNNLKQFEDHDKIHRLN